MDGIIGSKDVTRDVECDIATANIARPLKNQLHLGVLFLNPFLNAPLYCDTKTLPVKYTKEVRCLIWYH